MSKISGNPVQHLWNSVRSLRLTFGKNLVDSAQLWVTTALSTAIYRTHPHRYPQLFLPTHPCLNNCFTQFPQHLLLLTPDKK